MGLKGNLSTVDLANVFQVLHQGNSTGLLRIQAPEGPRFVELQNGAISIAGRSSGRVMLGDLLISRGLLDDERLEQALALQKESGKLLGEVLIENNFLSYDHLEEALKFQIEEEVCELFTLRKGDFDFLDSAALDARIAPAGGLVRLQLDLNALLLEAARRADEWKAIEQRIPSQTFLFRTTPEGDQLLQNSEGLSPEGMILLRLVKTHRTVEAMVQKACLGRFNTNRMLLELWDAGIIESEPLAQYDKLAREHIRMNRHDEAQRIAEFAKEFGSAEEKEKAQQILQEIEKSRKPASTTSALNVKADPKVRSEVIRRNQPNLMLKKQKSYAPLVVIGGLLVVAACGGLYYGLGLGSAALNKEARAAFDLVAAQAQEKIVEEKYSEGLQLLANFRSDDPDVQKHATDQYELRIQDVEAKLIHAAEKFKAARTGNNTDELNAAIQALQRFAGVTGLNKQVAAVYDETRAEVGKIITERRTQEFTARLKEIDQTEKPKGSEAVDKAYTALLADNPPESVAAVLRDNLHALAASRAEAERLIIQAKLQAEAGDTETAKMHFERIKQLSPGSPLAADADSHIETINKTTADSQAALEKLENQGGKAEDVRVAILKYLDTHPPYHLTLRALTTLHGLGGQDETQLAATLKSAQALYDKDPAAAKAKIVDLVTAHPWSRTAYVATLKVNVTSQPEGATVILNGKPLGPTPLSVDISAGGLSRISLAKEGFKTYEKLLSRYREDSLAVQLERLPAVSRRMPVAANAGLAILAEQVVFAGAPPFKDSYVEIVSCSRNNLKVNQRIDMNVKPEGLMSDRAPAALAVLNGELFMPTRDRHMWRARMATGTIHPFRLGDAATSLPELFESGEGAVLVLATTRGYESFKFDDESAFKSVTLGTPDTAPPWGMAFDGQHVVVPRAEGMLFAIDTKTGLKKWEAKTGGVIAGTPACHPARQPGVETPENGLFAVINEDGRAIAYSSKDGAEKWKQETGGSAVFGLSASAKGLLAVKKDGTLTLLGAADGAAIWTSKPMGEPVLAPLIVRADGPDERLLAVAVKSAAGGFSVAVLSPDTGAHLWSIELRAKPVAIAAAADRLYVALSNADLLSYDIK